MRRESWGFIDVAAPFKLRVFFNLSQAEEDLADYMAVGTTVRFNLGFSLKGPVACNINI